MIENPIESFNQKIKKRRVAVIGIGVSNVPLIRFLAERGAKITAHDRRTRGQLGSIYDELRGLGVEFVLGGSYLDEIRGDAEMIFKTPGVRFDEPAIAEAVAGGAVLSSEMELFFELCPAPIIGVTGSDGKTTTTSLIYDMLKRAGYKCYLGGNIGSPLIYDVESIKPDDKVVVELSSFQLHTMKKSPHIAVVTNVTPNHLDWHKDYDEYIEAKKAIFANQSEGGRAVFNYDNDITRSLCAEARCGVYFSRQNKLTDGYCINDGYIVQFKNGKEVRRILDTRDIYIPGVHNIENYMAAIAATEGLVSDEIIRETAKGFVGVPHRIEFVRELGGVKFYNDSIASSPARTTAGLNSFEQKVVLIAGGYDKKIPFDDFGAVVCSRVKKLVLCGFTADKIEAAVKAAPNFDGSLEIYKLDDFREAVTKAKDIAEPGDVVILSPACASFDKFKNFEERGNMFKQIVKEF
ncbi:MAG TPA: UDP-N-acetylmuramoyl-L-alanine--D-glutamate ligase [Candidatus Monoglobus merdigallinarum]|uniref:UDP-N-acetylmuramoylalanine--D-glutamate ligase n=1 Tax=Candidatus Monoglobus merdigallinarum TaxID=2838698 RepID=A0A9D1PQ13_9FIRM|nr:UDP-N-acetylmuramoyl-L-alanine--D-glutamate ligase [Candidatus Monoglobus merdigallinarum]